MTDARRAAEVWALFVDAIVAVAAPLTIGYVVVESVVERKIDLVLVVVAVAAFLWLSDVWKRRRGAVRRWRSRCGDEG